MPARTGQEWRAAVSPVGSSAAYYEWVEAAWPAQGEPARSVLFRVPGKWERRVLLWRATRVKDLGSHFLPSIREGMEAMQTEPDDGCPLERGPVVWLRDLVSEAWLFDQSDLAGLEWRPIPVPAGVPADA